VAAGVAGHGAKVRADANPVLLGAAREHDPAWPDVAGLCRRCIGVPWDNEADMSEPRTEAIELIARQVAVFNGVNLAKASHKVQAGYFTIAASIVATVERKMTDYEWAAYSVQGPMSIKSPARKRNHEREYD
jgi:hypothetical protein